jgi:hypothetical protein
MEDFEKIFSRRLAASKLMHRSLYVVDANVCRGIIIGEDGMIDIPDGVTDIDLIKVSNGGVDTVTIPSSVKYINMNDAWYNMNSDTEDSEIHLYTIEPQVVLASVCSIADVGIYGFSPKDEMNALGKAYLVEDLLKSIKVFVSFTDWVTQLFSFILSELQKEGTIEAAYCLVDYMKDMMTCLCRVFRIKKGTYEYNADYFGDLIKSSLESVRGVSKEEILKLVDNKLPHNLARDRVVMQIYASSKAYVYFDSILREASIVPMYIRNMFEDVDALDEEACNVYKDMERFEAKIKSLMVLTWLRRYVESFGGAERCNSEEYMNQFTDSIDINLDAYLD